METKSLKLSLIHISIVSHIGGSISSSSCNSSIGSGSISCNSGSVSSNISDSMVISSSSSTCIQVIRN